MSKPATLGERNVFVLSGGAARGAVQVGMIEVLLEHGIVPHALVGTSVGALNAAFLGFRADRVRAEELRRRWLRLRTRDIFPGGNLTRMAHLVRQRPYLYSSASLARLIAEWVPARRLEDLAVPVRIVTTPLAGETAVYHRHGPLNQLLLASAAVPAVFAPVTLPASCGHPGPHVDGGVSDLVPISGAADLAPTRVFVLDASVPARLPGGRTPIDILVASLSVAMRVRPAPDLGPQVAVHRMSTPDHGVRMSDFSFTERHMADGRIAAQRMLDEMTTTALLSPQHSAPVRRSHQRIWDRLHRAA